MKRIFLVDTENVNITALSSANRLDKITTGENIKDTSILVIQSATNRNNIYFITPNHY